MDAPVLYMGDTSLETAASYLAGVLKMYQIDFDYVSSSQCCSDLLLDKPYRAVILSDYPAANFTPAQLALLKTKVADGLGLVMIGGWESFIGQGGNYDTTILSDILPVTMQKIDDRINWSGPCVVEKTSDHVIVVDLPLAMELPVVGGFNEVKVKANAVTILSARRFSVARSANIFTFTAQSISPLLVVGTCGKGRVATFMSDVAPHWVGGLVDWGKKRITVKANGASEVEFGEYYAALFANIICWTANMEY
jgi:uncharacterized membrane protein